MIFCLTKVLYLSWLSIGLECFFLILEFYNIVLFKKIFDFFRDYLFGDIHSIFKNLFLPTEINSNSQEVNDIERQSDVSISSNEEKEIINNENEDQNANGLENNDNQEHSENEDENASNNDVNQDENKDGSKLSGVFSIFKIVFLCGMFEEPNEKVRFAKHYTVYKIIICIIITPLQLYAAIYPYVRGRLSSGLFALNLIVRIYFLYKNLAFNIIDGIINYKRIRDSLKENQAKFVYWLVIIVYIIAIILFIAFFSVFTSRSFVNIQNALFIENNDNWLRIENEPIYNFDSFCSANANENDNLQIDDLAMLTTLPRLYSATKNGKCYIKPKMRGLFNTTMKYIFGNDYEEQGIEIFCKKLSHYITLVIRSEKMLNKTIEAYSNNNIGISILEKQFDIVNKDYFKEFQLEKLNEEGKKLYKKYQDCLLNNEYNSCENDWDNFIQYYWSNMYSDDYEDIPGFERYQITIDSNMIIQPSFVTSENKLMSGTHYIVSGSIEDKWGIGLLIEMIGRKYIPSIFDNFVVMYSLISGIISEVFRKFDWFNSKLFYISYNAQTDLEILTELYGQFNFSNDALYTIGHSISGTEFKVLSSLTDIRGVVFESINTDYLGDFHINSELKKSEKGANQITNVYSTGNFLIEKDDNCNENGVLPERYYLPNVYDTACLTAITCSKTMKYVPFCKQILSINEFNKSFEAYLSHYNKK